MRIRGKSNIEPLDIEYYKCVASVAGDISKRIANELTPTFIVDEAISYFHDKEEYEICQTIKKFYDDNPTFFLDISRAEWFGTMVTVKKNKNNS
jgi:hypothetical protein